MENTLGSRLAKYRKAKGLSQEELAFKLDVSRQAVSKRERDEASPDTNNLIMLAKIYGVSLDDLLYKDPEEVNFKEEKNEETKETSTNKDKKKKGKEFVSIGKNGIHVIDDEDEVHVSWSGISVKSRDHEEDIDIDEELFHKGNFGFKIKNPKLMLIKNIINGSGYLLVAVIYLILGFTLPSLDGWRIYWTLFFIPDILNSTINCFIYKRVSSFNIAFLSAFIYLFIGMYMGLWHPTWLLFLAIPIFYIVVENIEKALRASKAKKAYNDKVVDSIEE